MKVGWAHLDFRWLPWLIFLMITTGGGGGAFLWLRHFDLHSYQARLASQLSESLKLQVEWGPLSVEWKNGSLQGENLRLRPPSEKIPVLTAEKLFLKFDPWPLVFGKGVSEEWTLIKPNFLFLQERNGKKNWEGILGARRPAVKEIQLEEGSFRLRDETQDPAFEIVMKGIDASLKEGREMIDFQGKAQFQNSVVEWETEVKPSEEKMAFRLTLGPGDAVFQGSVLNFKKAPHFQIVFQLKAFDWNSWVNLLGKENFMRGKADGEIRAEGLGPGFSEIQSSLHAEGHLIIQKGQLIKLNLVKTLMERLCSFPPLEKTLIPEWAQDSGTFFETLEADFFVQDQQILFDSLVLKNSRFLIEGRGVLDAKREVNFEAQLILLEETSRTLAAKIPSWLKLTNEEGRIVIPFSYHGYWPSTQPQPDWTDLSNRMTTS